MWKIHVLLWLPYPHIQHMHAHIHKHTEEIGIFFFKERKEAGKETVYRIDVHKNKLFNLVKNLNRHFLKKKKASKYM